MDTKKKSSLAAGALAAAVVVLGLRVHFSPELVSAAPDPPLGPTLRVNNNGTLANANTKVLNLTSGCTATASGTTTNMACTGAGGDITSVTAGSGLTGGGSSGDVTLNVGAGTGIDVTADAVNVDVTADFDWSGTHEWTGTAVGTTQTEFVTLHNTTAATVGAQRYSPAFGADGRGWSTGSSASQIVRGSFQVVPVQGTNALFSMVFYKQNGAESAVEAFVTFTENNPSSAIGAQPDRTTLVLGKSGDAASYLTGYGSLLVHDTAASPAYTSYTGTAQTFGIANADEAVLTATTFRPAVDFGLNLGTASQSFGITFSRHFAGEGTAPTASPGTGAGASGTCSVAGTDAAGTVTITTDAADTPAANANICTVTFNTAYDSAPRVDIEPSNDATWALTYGIIRYRQSDTTTGAFIIRSGSSALPATTAATYTVNYSAVQ